MRNQDNFEILQFRLIAYLATSPVNPIVRSNYEQANLFVESIQTLQFFIQASALIHGVNPKSKID